MDSFVENAQVRKKYLLIYVSFPKLNLVWY